MREDLARRVRVLTKRGVPIEGIARDIESIVGIRPSNQDIRQAAQTTPAARWSGEHLKPNPPSESVDKAQRVAAALKLYSDGATVKEIAKEIGKTPPTVRKWLKLEGVDLTRKPAETGKGAIPPETIAAALDEYQNNPDATCAEIERRHNLPINQIYKLARLYGVKGAAQRRSAWGR